MTIVRVCLANRRITSLHATLGVCYGYPSWCRVPLGRPLCYMKCSCFSATEPMRLPLLLLLLLMMMLIPPHALLYSSLTTHAKLLLWSLRAFQRKRKWCRQKRRRWITAKGSPNGFHPMELF